MPMFVALVMVKMVMLASGLGLAGATGQLMDQLDELIRRSVVFTGHIAGLD